MTDRRKIVHQGGEAEIVEKKSRFIATVEPAKREEDALALIERLRKKYWDASHNCFAYVIGERDELKRCSDDGEPSQTAGRPMLDVLVGEQIHDVCVVVTRYFGGTLLGTGGLVRAYSKAAKEGLSNSVLVEKCLGEELQLDCDYTEVGKIQYILAQLGMITLDSQYTDKVSLRVLTPIESAEKLKVALVEGTNGRVRATVLRQVYFGVVEQETVIFD